MPIPTETRGGTYIRGLADVRIRDDAELLIKMDEDGRIFTIPYVVSELGTIAEGRYRVSIGSDGSKLFGIVPEKGTYIVRYNGMVAQEGSLPVPKLIEARVCKKKAGGTWTAPAKLVFTVLLRVLSVSHKRLTIPLPLDYSFEQYKDSNETLIPLGSKSLEKTAKFVEMAGLDFTKDTIPWSENVLPFLDELFRDRNTKFQIVLEKGYVESIIPMPSELDDQD